MGYYVTRGKGHETEDNRIMQFFFIRGDRDEMDFLPVKIIGCNKV